ncbi:hypothetical protein ES703_104409 [subsurface metagenome]
MWGSPFQAGRWIHIAWHRKGVSQDDDNKIFANGNNFRSGGNWHYTDASPVNYNQPDNHLRLGERKAAPRLQTPPDSTLDEVLVFNGGGANKLRKILLDGRYYRENTGNFTSRPIDLAEKSGRPDDTSFTIFRVEWTEYKANLNAWLELDILSEDKNSLLNKRLKITPGEDVDVKAYDGPLIINGPIRYRVHFIPNTGLNDLAIAPLIFDDITIFYYSSPKLLQWLYVP